MMPNGFHRRQLIVSPDCSKNLLMIKIPEQHWKVSSEEHRLDEFYMNLLSNYKEPCLGLKDIINIF